MNKLEEYIDKYTKIHDGIDPMMVGETKTYSAGGKPIPNRKTYFDGSQFMRKFPPQIQKAIDLKQRAVSLLDYGCGQAIHTYRPVPEAHRLTFHAYFEGMIQSYYCYDPAVRKYSVKPSPGSEFDIVCCADVMEHVPEEFVDHVLTELNQYTKQDGMLLFAISGCPAKKAFSNGENLHITVKPFEWWVQKLDQNLNRSYALHYKTEMGDSSRVPPFEIIEPEKYFKGTRLHLKNSDNFKIW